MNVVTAKCTKCGSYVEFYTKSEVESGKVINGPICIQCGHEQCKVD